MALRFSDLSAKEFWKTAYPFFVVFFIGVAARLWYPSNVWPFQTTYALADALIVAGVVGVLIELFAAKVLIEKVSDDLAEKLIGRGLPKELQGHIRDIVKTAIVRDHYEKSYRFEDPVDGHVRIEMKITFEVRNYSDAPIDYKPEMEEEDSSQPEFLSLEYGIRGKKPHTLSQEQLSEIVEAVEEAKAKKVGGAKAVKLSSIHKDPTAVCNVM